ncbi:MAG: HPr family phosphocarrier protein [Angelakisella sp.]|nr:HPr family phosphocarrier protein [Angelakisella sp.]MCI9667048.1 HPr family phosphocarrier protein [Angelakisella sp.]
MVIKELQVQNQLGFHARVASRITRCASGFESLVRVKKDGKNYDLKSVTGVMMANAKHGETVTVEFEGADEQEAAQAMEALFADKFGER